MKPQLSPAQSEQKKTILDLLDIIIQQFQILEVNLEAAVSSFYRTFLFYKGQISTCENVLCNEKIHCFCKFQFLLQKKEHKMGPQLFIF